MHLLDRKGILVFSNSLKEKAAEEFLLARSELTQKKDEVRSVLLSKLAISHFKTSLESREYKYFIFTPSQICSDAFQMKNVCKQLKR